MFSNYAPAIKGENVIISGGTVFARELGDESEIYSIETDKFGTGENGDAVIFALNGGISDDSNKDNGTGKLIAAGEDGKAGITVGTGSKLNVDGGMVIAAGGDGGAGIGGDRGGNCGTVAITGHGLVKVKGGSGAEGIGKGDGGTDSGSLSKNSAGTVLAAEAGEGTADIGDTSNENYWKGLIIRGNVGTFSGNGTIRGEVEIPEGCTLTIPGSSTLTVGEYATFTNNGTIIIKGGGTLTNRGTTVNNGTVFAERTEDRKNGVYLFADGTIENNGVIIVYDKYYNLQTELGNEFTGTIIEYGKLEYVNEKGQSTQITGEVVIVDSETTEFEDGKTYIVLEDVEIPERIISEGNVKLILLNKKSADDYGGSLTASKGIEVNGTLSIYSNAQTDQSEKSSLICTGEGGKAGIEVGPDDTLNICLTDGSLIATSGIDGGAGIGGDINEDGGTVNIICGTVTATGGTGAEAIGHGANATDSGKFTAGYPQKNKIPVIFAQGDGEDVKAIGDISKQGKTWKGVIFEGGSGTVYADDITSSDGEKNVNVYGGADIPEGKTLTIPDGVNLRISNFVNNNGTIDVNGHLSVNPNGTLNNYGHINVSSELENNGTL